MRTVYSPVIKLRASEMQALKMLSLSTKNQIAPIIQLLPKEGKIQQKDYLNKRIKELSEAFAGSTMNFYADFDLLESSGTSNFSFMKTFLSMVSGIGINFVPVITQPQDTPRYRDLICNNYLANGICIKPPQYRLRNVSLDKLCTYLNKSLSSFIDHFKINESKVDILLDLNFIDHLDFEPTFDGFSLAEKMIHIIHGISNNKGYRSIIIAGGSFPKDLSDYGTDTETPIARLEWDIWNTIVEGCSEITLRYSDYGNIHPEFDPNQESHPGTCSIKYTVDNNFLILKGKLSHRHENGHGQYITKSNSLIAGSDYYGLDFSWGDRMIHDIANGLASSGNAGKWVQFTLNHHMTLITHILGISDGDVIPPFQLALLMR
ncbi:beta family protein [Cytophagaceae bacterium DM2B3-1]|uniref:Beta family protein n=1 Tax=Xanthocytophaga flava TaxID=3048013 RepID=A0ABT7CLE4_9BACT|nr:beta family protein [Xanthocytophaga flavus]MDJ1494517.1 beta family protein [Xanthocytophaga flavus]